MFVLVLCPEAAVMFPRFSSMQIHDCFDEPVMARPTMPAALKELLSQPTAAHINCAESNSRGYWKTVVPNVADGYLGQAVTDCVYDVFYLHDGLPCACVTLTSEAQHIEFACIDYPLADLHSATHHVSLAYELYRPHLEVVFSGTATCIYGEGTSV